MSGLKIENPLLIRTKNAKQHLIEVADKNELKDPVETTSFDTEDKITKPILQDEPQNIITTITLIMNTTRQRPR